MKHTAVRYLLRTGLLGALALPALVLAPLAHAARFETGETVSVAATSGNAYVAGGQVVVNGVTDRDLVAAGGSVLVSAPVGGDVLVGGGNVTITGAVAGDVRAAAGNLTIGSNVAGDVLALAGTVTIAQGATVSGDVVVASGVLVLDGNVRGNVVVNAGNVAVAGTISGDTTIHAETLQLGGELKRNATLVASSDLRVTPGLKLAGNVRYLTHRGHVDFGPGLAGHATFDESLAAGGATPDVRGLLMFIVGFLLLGLIWNALLILVFVLWLRRPFQRAAEHLAVNFWKDFGIGLLILIATPVAAVVLMVTVIGLPLGGLLMVAYVVALLLSKALPAIVAARWLERRSKQHWSTAKIFWVSVGIMVALQLVGLIPFIGWVPSLLLIPATYGALAVAKREAYKQIA
ncbi:MAG: polymer-forming cytoskeletal protein [Candidatus Andersenbacteria bacterium]